ncbi:hypothetical protein GCWU000323_02902, partial [Leptotrichia hofstadii F0254]
SSLGALNGEAQWVDRIMELMDAVDDLHSNTRKTSRPSIPNAD